jgi:hypothetical protein
MLEVHVIEAGAAERDQPHAGVVQGGSAASSSLSFTNEQTAPYPAARPAVSRVSLGSRNAIS